MTNTNLIELLDTFPEINPANYGDDDVNALNAWGIAAHTALEAQAKQIEALQADVDSKADMFWNHDDAEQMYQSIDEFLNDEICNGAPLEVGHTRTIQRAVRLSNLEIRITKIHEEECEADYEIIPAAMKKDKL